MNESLYLMKQLLLKYYPYATREVLKEDIARGKSDQHYSGQQMEIYNKTAFQVARKITKNYSTSFYLSTRVLERETRSAIYAIYGFVRYADEIVDTFHHVNQKHMLELFERDYREAVINGISMNPVLHAFILVVKKYEIPQPLVDAFLESMRMDLEKKEYPDFGELREYIYGSAEVVGLMCLKVFVNGSREDYENLAWHAQMLGSAFQKVNFMRDMNEDITSLNRHYFPGISLKQFDDGYKNMIVNEILSDFRNARRGISKLPGRSRLAVYIAYKVYLMLLKKIGRTPANIMITKRVRISNMRKIALFFYSLIKFRLNLI